MTTFYTYPEHAPYWTRNTLEPFWSGEAFYLADEGQELSYNLSQILIRNIMSDYSTKFPEFLLAANYVDAGEAASLETFGVGIDRHASQFLGSGNWAPASTYQLPNE